MRLRLTIRPDWNMDLVKAELTRIAPLATHVAQDQVDETNR